SETKRLGIGIQTSSGVTAITKKGEEYILTVNNVQVKFDRVIITTGGQPKKSGLDWLSSLGLEIVDPVPSLFTFNMPNNPICKLMGTVVNPAHVKVEGTKLHASGPLLITHWGMSGPAILLLSAWGARVLHENEYTFNILVNWLPEKSEESLRGHFKNMKVSNENKMMVNYAGLPLTQRLWEFLMEKAGVPTAMRWKDFGTKNENKLLTVLLQDRYSVKGKTTFKEEFVTAGGISMMEVDVHRMEVKKYPGLYVAGEVLDIDGITGGFNFQAAWTTGYIAGKSAVR
ncbi:MAG: aminoacetone oxidase family FAD-binding enzyme, partial [Crocinitomicaceae bacterium]